MTRREFLISSTMTALAVTLWPAEALPGATVERYWPGQYPWGNEGVNVLLRFVTADPRRGLTQLTMNGTDYLNDSRAVAYIHSWFQCRALWEDVWHQVGDETEMDFRIEILRPRGAGLYTWQEE